MIDEKRLHDDELRQFERLLQQQKVGNIAARLELWQIFLALDHQHLTAEELFKKLKVRGWVGDLDLVKDTLQLLVYFGLVSESHLDGAIPRYEHRHLDEHHDHLVCLRCGKISEFHNRHLEDLQQGISRDMGFFPLNHRLVIRGICAECLSRRLQNLPVDQCSLNEDVIVEQVGSSFAGQLSNLGIIPGAQLKLLSRGPNGVVVVVNGSRLALSKDWCEHITVRQDSQFCNLP